MRTPPSRRRSVVAALALAGGLVAVPVVTAAPAGAACTAYVVGTPSSTSTPVISGQAKVGKTVSVSTPTWDMTGVTTTFQWLRGGEDISGATQATYALTGDDFEQSISVRATGTTSACLLPGQVDSAAIEPDLGDAITPTTAPAVTGTAAPGSTLTTTSGTWPGDPTPVFTYQWYRSRATGGTAERIAGATTTTYTPTAADTGRKIVAVVTADRYGYEKGVALSNVVQMPKGASVTTLALVKSTVKRTQAPSVRVSIASSVGLVPTGLISIYDGTRKIRSFRIAPAANGTVTFQIARQTVGKHRITARYAGDTAHKASVSSVKILTVTR